MWIIIGFPSFLVFLEEEEEEEEKQGGGSGCRSVPHCARAFYQNQCSSSVCEL